MKSWIIEEEYSGAAAVVWAYNLSKAKGIVLEAAWFSDVDKAHLESTRTVKLDHHHDVRYMICDEPLPEDQTILRGLGWSDQGCDFIPCEVCGLFPWTDLPESKLNKDNICVGCSK